MAKVSRHLLTQQLTKLSDFKRESGIRVNCVGYTALLIFCRVFTINQSKYCLLALPQLHPGFRVCVCVYLCVFSLGAACSGSWSTADIALDTYYYPITD